MSEYPGDQREANERARAAIERDILVSPAPETLNALGDVDLNWRTAALLLGEQLAANGPEGYYLFTPAQWIAWARKVVAPPPPAVDDSLFLLRADLLAWATQCVEPARSFFIEAAGRLQALAPEPKTK